MPSGSREQSQCERGERHVGDDEPSGHSVIVQPVADAADRHDQRRVAELLAQRRDVHVEGLGRSPPVLVPHLFDDPLAAHDRARALGEPGEQVELLAAERDLAPVDVDPPGTVVDRRRRNLLHLAIGVGRAGEPGVERRSTAPMRATSSRKPNGFTT